MRKECLGSLTALLAAAGLGLAQTAPVPPPLTLPAELPAAADAPAPKPANPDLFPFPGTGIYDTPDDSAPESASAEPAPKKGKLKKGKDGPHCHFWASGETLLWFVSPGSTPPLIAVGDAGGAPGSLDYGLLVGGRVAAGFTNAADDFGIEFGGLWLPRSTTHSGATSGPDGSAALGRPLNDVLLHAPLLLPVSVPGALAGGVNIASSTQLWGLEANVAGNVVGTGCLAIDLMGGVRYLSLDESLAVNQTGNVLAGGVGLVGGPTMPTSFSVADSFRTRNQFYGGQVGSQLELRFGRLYTNLLGKVAVGNVHQVVDVRGDSTLNGPAGSVTVPGGVLALASNSGRQAHDEFGVLPEVNFNVGYQVTPGIRVYAGYTFLYLSDVVRPGEQVNTLINQAQVPTSPLFGAVGGPAQPAPLFNRGDFWAQGVNIGLALRY